VILVRPFGVVGDALGTTIPLAFTSLLFLPVYLCRLLEVPLSRFLYRAYVPPLALCAAPVGALLLMKRWAPPPQTYLQLAVQVAVAGILYGAGLLWMFVTREPAGVKLWQQLTGRLKQVWD